MSGVKTLALGEGFDSLLKIIARLRDPQTGCPWDKAQSFESLRNSLLSEVYEVFDAVEDGPKQLVEELGDLFSILALYCQIASDQGAFDPRQIFSEIVAKLIRRHPHVFGSASASSAQEAQQSWNQEKAKEKIGAGLLDSVPRSMPALKRAHEIGSRCAQVNFEWPTFEGVREKVLEEIAELIAEVRQNPTDAERQQDEFGDILFALSQLARRMGYNSEELLHKACKKFTGRFTGIEELAKQRFGAEGLKGLSLTEMDILWEEVKSRSKSL